MACIKNWFFFSLLCFRLNASELIPELKGIVITESDVLDHQKRPGIAIVEHSVILNEKQLKEHLQPFLGSPLTAEGLCQIQEIVQESYQQAGQPLVVIRIPEQDISDGICKTVVHKSTLEKLRIQNEKWTSPELLASYLKIQPGDPIDEKELRKNLSFINRNPFRRANLIYSPGKKTYTTDLSLYVEDRWPARFYLGADNTGIHSIERERFYGGFNWGKAFGYDSLLAYQYTSSYDFHRFQAHTVQWISYLPWQHTLSIYGGYSSVYPKLIFPTDHSTHGQSAQASARYVIPLLVQAFFSDEFFFGADYKWTNNTVNFVEILPQIAGFVNLTQIMAGYRCDYEKPQFKFSFVGEAFCSPGPWLPHQSNSDYEALRPAAKNHWIYARTTLEYFQRLPWDFAVSLQLRGQISSQNLLPSEQLGIGGYDTVRGYEERQDSKDAGLIANAEVRSPPIAFLTTFWNIKARDALQFLAFADYGVGHNHNRLPGEPSNDYLFGIGPGFRYTLDPYIAVRFDLGFRLHDKAAFTGHSPMIHFAATASY